MQITKELVRSGEYYKQVVDQIDQNFVDSTTLPWILWLLENSIDPLSSHKEYIELLPKVNNSHVMLWTEDELELLTGSSLDELRYVFKPNVEWRFEMLLRLVPDFGVRQKHSLVDWTEAHVLFTSRNFDDP